MQPLDLLTVPLGALLERVVNTVLGLDAASRARLRALHGRSVRIRAEDLQQTWRLDVVADRLLLRPDDAATAAPPSVVVSGSAAQLVVWLASRGTRGRVRVDGDNDTLLELLDVLDEFDPLPGTEPDADGPLGALFTAPLAERALGAVELAAAGLRSAVEGARSSAAAAASDQFVDRGHFDTLLDGVDALTLRIDRLEARLRARAGPDAGTR